MQFPDELDVVSAGDSTAVATSGSSPVVVPVDALAVDDAQARSAWRFYHVTTVFARSGCDMNLPGRPDQGQRECQLEADKVRTCGLLQ